MLRLTKVCTRCSSEKDLDDFSTARNRPDGKQIWCKPCQSEYQHQNYRKYRERNIAYAKEYNRKSKYGVSAEQLSEMILRQDGLCAICSIPMETVAVDHDHSTGAIRGLLCRTCNGGLGMFKDDVSFLESAIEYLKKSRQI